MTENHIQPNNQDENLQSQSAASSTTGFRRRSGFLRAVVYTPAILCLGALAALATFPELADRIAASGGSHASSGARCMFSCPFSSPAKDTSESAKLITSGGCCSSQQSAGL